MPETHIAQAAAPERAWCGESSEWLDVLPQTDFEKRLSDAPGSFMGRMGGSRRQQGNVGFLGILGLVLIVFLVVGECSKPARTWDPPAQRTKHDPGVAALCEAGKRHRQRMRVTEASLVEAIEHCQQPGNSDSCKSDMTDEIWQEIREPVVKMYLPGNALVLRKTDEKCGSGLVNMQARLSNLLTDLRKLVGR